METIEAKKSFYATHKTTFSAIIFLIVFFIIFGYLAHEMGVANMMNTLLQTPYHLLLETVFFLMGITVLMGALACLLTEFGVVQLLEKILRPIMKPVFNLPGAAAIGAVVTFLSDNPAIISLSRNKKFSMYFKTYQFVSLTNFGTAFGMGLVVLVFMMAQGYMAAPLVGLFGSFCGCVISTRLMQRYTLKSFPEYSAQHTMKDVAADSDEEKNSESNNKQGLFMRILNAMLTGGKSGVDLGLSIIPGVLIISTFVMILTFKTPAGEFDGSAYQGVGLLPLLADKINIVFEVLFGFDNSQLLAFPMTALGAVGAALGLVPKMQADGILNDNAVAVFTAIGMCWSGYLSTHAAMLDSMGYRHLISKAILSHTIAGLFAGIIAHWAWVGVDYVAFRSTDKVQYSVENVYGYTEFTQIEISDNQTDVGAPDTPDWKWVNANEWTMEDEISWKVEISPAEDNSYLITNLLRWDETLVSTYDEDTGIITIKAGQVIYLDKDNDNKAYAVSGGIKGYTTAESMMTALDTYNDYIPKMWTPMPDIQLAFDNGKITNKTPIFIFVNDENYEGYMGYGYSFVTTMKLDVKESIGEAKDAQP